MNRVGATTMDDMQDFWVSLRKVTLRLSLIFWVCMSVADRLHARPQQNRQFLSGPIEPGHCRVSIDLLWWLA